MIMLRSTRIISCNLARTIVLLPTSQMKDGVAKKMNRALLEKVRYLLSNASLDKSFWAEAIEYASHLLNRLPTTLIGSKTLLEIWSSGVACDHGSLRVFGCPANVDIKKDMLDSM